MILGAGAVALNILKTITTKHLATSSSWIQFLRWILFNILKRLYDLKNDYLSKYIEN